MPATAMAVVAARADPCWNRFRVDRADVFGEGAQLVAGRRVGGEVALGVADDAGLGRDVEAHLAAVPTTSSVEPPPTSMTSVGVGVAGRALARRAAKGQPRLLVAGDDPRVEPVALVARVARKSSPLAASRTALVSTATARSAPCCVDDRPVLVRASPSTRAIGVLAQHAGLVEPVAEARDLRAALALGQRCRRRTSATSSRVELVPMSTTATRSTAQAASAGADGVGHRPAVERREQVVDRAVGHGGAGRGRGRADVGDDEQVRRLVERVVGRERLGVGDVERRRRRGGRRAAPRRARPGRRSGRGRC